MTEDKRKEASDLGKDPALLYRIGLTLKTLGLAGELVNALLLYLILTSRIFEKILSAAIKGESSAGKSQLVEKILKLLPKEAYLCLSGMSKQALIYLQDDLRNRHVVIAEAVGMHGADFNWRTLLSENVLEYWVVEKDPKTNENVTRKVRKEGPTGLITTTTNARLYHDNETRILTLSTDESDEQTQRVKMASAATYESGPSEVDLSSFINLQRMLAEQPSNRVHIPYATYLAENTPIKPLRIRRDYTKLCDIIKVSAALHRFQRPQMDDGVIIANLEDYFFVKVLFEQAFFNSLFGVNPNTRTIMEAIRQLCTPDENGFGNLYVTTDQLLDYLDWDKSKLSRWQEPLKEYGWIIDGTKPYRYKEGREIEKQGSTLPSLEEMADRFPDMAKDFMAVHPLTGVVCRLKNADAMDAEEVQNDVAAVAN
jgi:hypothetical protein